MIILTRADKPGKKMMAIFDDGARVYFGAQGYEDYTQHRSLARKSAYIKRHRARESWGMRGLRTPGFWARWILWNKPTIAGSARDVEARFKVKIKLL